MLHETNHQCVRGTVLELTPYLSKIITFIIINLSLAEFASIIKGIVHPKINIVIIYSPVMLLQICMTYFLLGKYTEEDTLTIR